LNENRPKPIMLLKNKEKKKVATASKIVKEATLFGWHNNLEISDGSTIPGLGDRVMAWEDADEDFKFDEKETGSQGRYNPSYNFNGMYYVLDNIRGWPYPAESSSRDYSNIYPNSRLASVDMDGDGDIDYRDYKLVLSVLKRAKKKIIDQEIPTTRFIVSPDVFPEIDRIFGEDERFKIVISKFNSGSEEDLYSVWIACHDVDIEDIKKAENLISLKKEINKESGDFLEKLFGSNMVREKTIKNIIKEAKGICKEIGVKDVYLVGGCARDIYMGNPLGSVRDLDFSGAWPNQSLKLGGILAERLGVSNAKIYNRTMTLSFVYNGIKVDFKGNFSPVEIRSRMRSQNIATTPLNNDVFNRDFTMNMIVYDINKDKLYDVSGRAFKDINDGVIKTYFDADYIIKNNPLVIFRALKFKIRYGFEISPELSEAILRNASVLFDGQITDERLIIGRDSVLQEGYKQANILFDMYGLEKVKEL
jgi:hypothetical protein